MSTTTVPEINQFDKFSKVRLVIHLGVKEQGHKTYHDRKTGHQKHEIVYETQRAQI